MEGTTRDARIDALSAPQPFTLPRQPFPSGPSSLLSSHRAPCLLHRCASVQCLGLRQTDGRGSSSLLAHRGSELTPVRTSGANGRLPPLRHPTPEQMSRGNGREGEDFLGRRGAAQPLPSFPNYLIPLPRLSIRLRNAGYQAGGGGSRGRSPRMLLAGVGGPCRAVRMQSGERDPIRVPQRDIHRLSARPRAPRMKECYFEGRRNLRESVDAEGQARPII